MVSLLSIKSTYIVCKTAAIAQSVLRLATGWTVRRLNPGGGEIFRAVQNGPEAHPSSCTMGTGSLPGVRRSERGIDYPRLSSTGRANSFKLQFRLPPVPVHACHGVTFISTFTLYKDIYFVLQRGHIGAAVEILAS